MGKRKYPPLTPAEVKSILVALGFRHDRTQGAHAHYVREAIGGFPRTGVTVGECYSEFDYLSGLGARGVLLFHQPGSTYTVRTIDTYTAMGLATEPQNRTRGDSVCARRRGSSN